MLHIEPDNYRARMRCGNVDWSAGENVKAREYMLASIIANPQHVAGLHTLARLELEEGHVQEARSLFAQGRKLEPKNVYVLQVSTSASCHC